MMQDMTDAIPITRYLHGDTVVSVATWRAAVEGFWRDQGQASEHRGASHFHIAGWLHRPRARGNRHCGPGRLAVHRRQGSPAVPGLSGRDAPEAEFGSPGTRPGALLCGLRIVVPLRGGCGPASG